MYSACVSFFFSFYIFASSLLTPHLLWSLFALFVSELFINLVCVLFYRFLLHYSSTSAFSLYPSVSLVYIIIFLPSVTLCFLYLTRGFGVLSMFLCLTSSLFLSLSTLPSFIFENCLTLFKQQHNGIQFKRRFITANWSCPFFITANWSCPCCITANRSCPFRITANWFCPIWITATWSCPCLITANCSCPFCINAN